MEQLSFLSLGAEWARVAAALAALALLANNLDLGVDFQALARPWYVKAAIVFGVAVSATRRHIASTVVTLALAALMYPVLPKKSDKNVNDASTPRLPPVPLVPPVPAVSAVPAIPAIPAADRLAAAAERAKPQGFAMPAPPKAVSHLMGASATALPQLPPSPFF